MNTDRFKFRVCDRREKRYLNAASLKINGDGTLLLCGWNCGLWENKYLKDASNIAIEQCTGLKDADGKLIYEGDILQHKNGDGIAYIEHGLDTARFEATVIPNKARRFIVGIYGGIFAKTKKLLKLTQT